MSLSIILFLIGLIALIGGAKLLVLGASQLALTFGISSLTIGLTVVAFGTSAPEIGISIFGALRGEGELVIGNIIGSNIFNILLVLGICASITPLVVRRQLIWWDVPLMILASLLFWWLASNGMVGHPGGFILLGGIFLYLIFTFLMLKKQPPLEEKALPTHPIWLQLVWIGVGLILLAIGAELLVTGATKMARYLGISELFIGLTVVAIGTSAPEIATTLIALRKGERDMVIGNVVGSNIFNLLGVLGIAALISPDPIVIPVKATTFDIPIMVGVAIATLPIFLTGHRLSRWEGFLFLFYYVLYIVFLFLEAGYSHYLPYFTTALLFFILPLTVLTLIVGVVRHFKQKRA